MAAPAPACRPARVPDPKVPASWDAILWEQFEYLMSHKEDERFSDLCLLLLSPFMR
jgi:hypothetical protein